MNCSDVYTAKNVRMLPDWNLFWTVWISDKLSAVITQRFLSQALCLVSLRRRSFYTRIFDSFNLRTSLLSFFNNSFLSSLISMQVFTRWLGYLSLIRWAVFHRSSSSAPWVINKRALQRRRHDGLIVHREFWLTEQANGVEPTFVALKCDVMAHVSSPAR